MQSLVNVPEVHNTMQELSREMMKAGIMDEMVEEVLDTMEPLEEEADGEVENVILEITQGKRGASLSLPERSIDLPELPAEQLEEEAETEAQVDEVQDEVEQMRDRLEELRTS